MADRDLSSYIEVATRIADFRKAYPEGTLQPWNPAEPWRLVQAEGFINRDVVTITYIVYVAAAYRNPEDPRPGVGMAWEEFPGRTNFTRGSELQNAETSAWGRAIIAVGASDSKAGIASREEVAARRAERDPAADIIEQVRASRRRDPEVDKDGAATFAEQTRMMTGPEPGVHRSVDAVVDDRWTTDAPSWVVGVDPPEDEPGSILPAQRSQIMAVYAALGIKDRDKRMSDVCVTLDTHVESVNDLSHKQAAALLEVLHERHSGKMVRHG
jgi:hypothetical protein